jgi:hypothetical protein
MSPLYEKIMLNLSNRRKKIVHILQIPAIYNDDAREHSNFELQAYVIPNRLSVLYIIGIKVSLRMFANT